MTRTESTASPLLEPLREALRSRHPILCLQSSEEARVVEAIALLAAEGDGVPLLSWSCTDGLDGDETRRDPVAALQAVAERDAPGYVVFKDLAPFLGEPAVQRALRDAYYRLRERPDTHLFLVAPHLELPATLRGSVQVVTVPPPGAAELAALVDEIMAGYSDRELPAVLADELVTSLRGLTVDEARHVLHTVMSSGKLSRQRLLEAVHAAKKGLASGSANLEYVPVDFGLDAVGGLDNLKEWIDTRAAAFNPRALRDGLPVPRGILIMGVSGCGKSLCAKVVAKMWNVPLFRLDMNLVFSGLQGSPEATFHAALRSIESLAPAVLWIDEIENGLGIGEGGAMQQHIFSAFLTWMQEKPPLVFVAATANRIECLPAEMIRKGRFDQVFFVDLPDDTERSELFSIHLRHHGVDPADYDAAVLVRETRGWNGAEIEQAVIAARLEGLRHQRPFTTADIVDNARTVVPLSRTMSEQIKMLRNWAWDRATPASRGKGMAGMTLGEEDGDDE